MESRCNKKAKRGPAVKLLWVGNENPRWKIVCPAERLLKENLHVRESIWIEKIARWSRYIHYQLRIALVLLFVQVF